MILQVANNLLLSNVVIDLNCGLKPSCEIVCPFLGCKIVPKLSLVRSYGPPKFNPYNFERHYQSQHLRLNAKRSPFVDITNENGNKIRVLSADNSNLQNLELNQSNQCEAAPSGVVPEVEKLKGEVIQLQQKINELEALLREQTNALARSEELKKEMQQLQEKIAQLIQENDALKRQQQKQDQEHQQQLEVMIRDRNQASGIAEGLKIEMQTYCEKTQELIKENNALKQLQQQQHSDIVSLAEIQRMKNELTQYRGDIKEELISSLIAMMDKFCTVNGGSHADVLNEELHAKIKQQQEQLLECEKEINLCKEREMQRALHVRKMADEMHARREENVCLRHKVMDVRGTIRAFGRIKPRTIDQEAFEWNRSIDGTILRMCK